MDFNTLSRRQLQAVCKKNKLPANLTNLAMADSLNSLEIVEGIEEILNQSESEIAQSPMVPPTGGRSRTVKTVGVLETPAAAPTTATRRRAAPASTSVRRKIEVSSKDSLDEIAEVKKDVSVKTPAPASRRRGVREASTVKHAYSTRRSTRLADKIEEPKEISEAIKIDSFTEVIDENVDQSENSEITVIDNFKESEVKSNDESKEILEETSEIPNADVAVASIVQNVSSDIHGLVYEEVCVIETEGSIEDTKVYSYVAQETKASIEDTEMNSNENDELKASVEETKMNSNMDEETEASTEKVAVIESNVNEASSEDGNVDEVTKVVSIEEDTDMNNEDDKEIDITEIKVADVVDSCNVVKEQEAYADEIETDGYMVDNFTVNIQETNDKELPSEDETSDDEESDMSDAEIQDNQGKFELVGDDKVGEPEEMNAAPLINDDLASSKTPITVGRLSKISDDKENFDIGQKSVQVEEPLENLSIRQLTKLVKEKLHISKQLKKEDDMKDTTTPALKTLPENMMVVESQD